ncbi:MAG: hypothetical protein SPL52_13215 [Fibrobacter sp.]|nr:hypothetical protein [Fibrobacter sp.]
MHRNSSCQVSYIDFGWILSLRSRMTVSAQDDTGKVGEPAEPTILFTSASSVNL